MRSAGLLALALLLAGCLDRYETLRPQTSATDRALRAIVAKPSGPGPFPVLLILHGAAGPRPNGERWAAEARELGYMTVVPDQYGPLGITDTLTRQGALWERYRDTHSMGSATCNPAPMCGRTGSSSWASRRAGCWRPA